MVFQRCLSDSKSPQVSRTLHRIMAILNNAVVWIVSTRPSVSKSSSPFNNPLVTLLKAAITIGIIVTFMHNSFFQFPSKDEVLILLFTFFQFYFVVSHNCQVHNFTSSLFLLLLLLLLIIIRSGLLAEISHPFGCQIWISCTSSIEFPCPPSHIKSYTPSVPICCIRLWCDRWFRLYRHMIYICYFLMSYLFSLWWLFLMSLSWAAIRRDSVTLLKFPLLGHVLVFSCEMLSINHSKRPLSCFFPYLFPSYCHSIVHRVVCIISDGYNQSPFEFFYVVIESFYGSVSAVFNAGKSLPPSFLIHIVSQRRLWDIMPYAWSLVLFFFGPFA